MLSTEPCLSCFGLTCFWFYCWIVVIVEAKAIADAVKHEPHRSRPSPVSRPMRFALFSTSLGLTTSYLLPVRHPVQAAEEVAVLDRMSGGRVILGVGRGFADSLFSVAVMSDGRVVVGGTTSSQDFPIAGAALQPGYGGGELDGFVTILDADLQNVQYSSYIGGSSFEALFTSVDAADRLLVGGLTGSDDLATTGDALQAMFLPVAQKITG